jgi:hypothetical protein
VGIEFHPGGPLACVCGSEPTCCTTGRNAGIGLCARLCTLDMASGKVRTIITHLDPVQKSARNLEQRGSAVGFFLCAQCKVYSSGNVLEAQKDGLDERGQISMVSQRSSC